MASWNFHYLFDHQLSSEKKLLLSWLTSLMGHKIKLTICENEKKNHLPFTFNRVKNMHKTIILSNEMWKKSDDNWHID